MLNTPTLTNTELVDLWLHGKSANTIDGYRRYAERFFSHVNKHLCDCTLMDFQVWVMTLSSSDNSKRVAVGAIKSLFSFAKQLGVISTNLGILVKSPKAKNRLAEPILTQEEVQLLINSTTNERDKIFCQRIIVGQTYMPYAQLATSVFIRAAGEMYRQDNCLYFDRLRVGLS